MIVIVLAIFVLPTYCSFDYADVDILQNYDVEYAQLADASQHHDGKIGYSSGSSLRSIAEGSSDTASDAVNNQDAAGHQAAYVAKNTLAQAAAGASATAQAALAGKQIILQGLEQQYRDAQVSLDGEKQQLMQAQRAADSTRNAAQEARAHVQVLQNTLNAAQAAAETVTQAASEAAGELAAQQAMVGSAMQRLESIAQQLQSVRIDYEATRSAAMKAQAAAQAAAANAAAAAAAAAADLAKKAGKIPHKHGHGGKREAKDDQGASGSQISDSSIKPGSVSEGNPHEGKYVQSVSGSVPVGETDFYRPFYYNE